MLTSAAATCSITWAQLQSLRDATSAALPHPLHLLLGIKHRGSVEHFISAIAEELGSTITSPLPGLGPPALLLELSFASCSEALSLLVQHFSLSSHRRSLGSHEFHDSLSRDLPRMLRAASSPWWSCLRLPPSFFRLFSVPFILLKQGSRGARGGVHTTVYSLAKQWHRLTSTPRHQVSRAIVQCSSLNLERVTAKVLTLASLQLGSRGHKQEKKKLFCFRPANTDLAPPPHSVQILKTIEATISHFKLPDHGGVAEALCDMLENSKDQPLAPSDGKSDEGWAPGGTDSADQDGDPHSQTNEKHAGRKLMFFLLSLTNQRRSSGSKTGTALQVTNDAGILEAMACGATALGAANDVHEIMRTSMVACSKTAFTGSGLHLHSLNVAPGPRQLLGSQREIPWHLLPRFSVATTLFPQPAAALSQASFCLASSLAKQNTAATCGVVLRSLAASLDLSVHCLMWGQRDWLYKSLLPRLLLDGPAALRRHVFEVGALACTCSVSILLLYCNVQGYHSCPNGGVCFTRCPLCCSPTVAGDLERARHGDGNST